MRIRLLFVLPLIVGMCFGQTPTPVHAPDFYSINTGDTIGVKLSHATTGVFNVLDYGADPTGNIDNSAIFQQAIDAAGNGRVYIPSGRYKASGLVVEAYSPIIEGAGWSGLTGGTEIFAADNRPIFTIRSRYGSETGTVLRNMRLSSAYDSSAVRIMTQGGILLDQIHFLEIGGHAVELIGHVSVLTIQHCQFQTIGKDAVFGKNQDSQQLNAIRILNNNIGGCRNGINITGSHIVIRDNTIESTSGAGVLLTAIDTTYNSESSSVQILDNYFEAIGGGSIRFIGNWVAPNYSYVGGLRIAGNYFGPINAATLDTACHANIWFSVVSSTIATVVDLEIGVNTYGNSLAYVDFGGTTDPRRAFVVHQGGTGTDTHYLHRYTAETDRYVQFNSPYKTRSHWPISPATPEYGGSVHWDQDNGLWWMAKEDPSSAWQPLTYSPVIGTTAPSRTPRYFGEEWFNTYTGRWYKAKDTTATSDWEAIDDSVRIANLANTATYTTRLTSKDASGTVIDSFSTDANGLTFPVNVGKYTALESDGPMMGRATFDTTATRLAIVCAGANARNIVQVTPLSDGIAPYNPHDNVRAQIKTDSIVVTRDTSGTTGLEVNYFRTIVSPSEWWVTYWPAGGESYGTGNGSFEGYYDPVPPGYESYLGYRWSFYFAGASVVKDTSETVGGSRAALIRGDGSSNSVLFLVRGLTAGEWYTATFYARTDVGTNNLIVHFGSGTTKTFALTTAWTRCTMTEQAIGDSPSFQFVMTGILGAAIVDNVTLAKY